MVRVIMHGCNGHMGQVITSLVQEEEGMEIVAGIDLVDCRDNGYPVYTNINDCREEADVIIDFASAKATDALLAFGVKRRIPMVLCTTGLTKEQMQAVEEASQKVAVLKEAANILVPAGFDIEIVEKHHNRKVDAPSGTALALADSINESLGNEYEYKFDRSQTREKRDKKEIGISAVRGGTIVGDHDVIFAGTDEVVTFSHTAYSRAIFAKGAIQAARFLAGKPAGYYQMSHVIDGQS